MLSSGATGTHRATAPAQSRPLQVLVVDDDPASRRAICGAIASLGHRCRAVSSGRQALHEHGIHRADVIVADWTMPVMDGMELCRHVRDMDTGTYTYLLFTSGMATKRDFVDAALAGADDCLSKPIDLDELEARLIAAGRVVTAYRKLAERNAGLRHDSQAFFQEARVDPLTGIGNRLRLEEDVVALQASVTRYGRRVCVAMCDIDGFKHYNDHFGHLAGDAALRAIAQAIRGSIRDADRVYRYGGEEFLVVLPEQAAGPGHAAVERVLKAVEDLHIEHAPKSGRRFVTVSAGVCSITPDGDPSLWAGIARADRALFRAKAMGGNTHVGDEVT